jgi:hypothetical protein
MAADAFIAAVEVMFSSALHVQGSRLVNLSLKC